MKVTLIYPGIVGVGFDSLGKGGMDRNWVNLGLAYIGAYLKERSYDVTLIDLRECLDWDDVAARMSDHSPDIFGIYFNTPNFNHSLRCATIAKSLGKVVVAGGPHATVAPDELVRSGHVDYVVVGEGEAAFHELLEAIASGHPPKERILQGQPIADLDNLPFPDRDLYNVRKVITPLNNFPFLDNGVIMMTSRGCPARCAFCQPLGRRLFGAKVRFRSVESTLKEIRYVIERYKVRYISFQDDTFTVRKKWVIDLCNRIKSEKLVFQWSAQSRVDRFDEELAKAMSEAGCVCLFIGFESGSQRILDFLKKDISPRQSRDTAALCKKYGILMLADFMLGVPTETEDDLRATLDLIKAIRPEMLSPTYFTPIVGCELYDYCKSNDLITISRHEDFTRNPVGEKIRGIDYKLLAKYNKSIHSFAMKWYHEKHYARLAVKRWLHLGRKGHLLAMLQEISRYTLPIPAGFGIRTLLRKTLGTFRGQG